MSTTVLLVIKTEAQRAEMQVVGRASKGEDSKGLACKSKNEQDCD